MPLLSLATLVAPLPGVTVTEACVFLNESAARAVVIKTMLCSTLDASHILQLAKTKPFRLDTGLSIAYSPKRDAWRLA